MSVCMYEQVAQRETQFLWVFEKDAAVMLSYMIHVKDKTKSSSASFNVIWNLC